MGSRVWYGVAEVWCGDIDGGGIMSVNNIFDDTDHHFLLENYLIFEYF